MAIKDAPRIKETTTTTGTGTLSLTGAVAGFQTAVAGIGTGNSMYYFLLDADGAAWEMGLGTITAGTPDTQTRAAIKSSNSDALINLSAGTHTVFNASLPGFASGDMNFADLILQRPEIKDYSETVATPAISAGTLTLNLENGNVFNVTHDANITTLAISNPPASGKAGSFTLRLTQDATGGRTIAFPASCKFAGGTALSLSTTASKRNKLVFDTIDGGTTWDVALVGKDYA